MSKDTTTGILYPVPKTFPMSDGTEVVIKKSKLKDFEAIAQFVGRVLNGLKVENGQPTVNLLDPAFILQLISTHAKDVYNIIVMHTSITMDELMESDTDDVVLLAVEVVTYNKRFFTERIAPLLSGAKGA